MKFRALILALVAVVLAVYVGKVISAPPRLTHSVDIVELYPEMVGANYKITAGGNCAFLGTDTAVKVYLKVHNPHDDTDTYFQMTIAQAQTTWSGSTGLYPAGTYPCTAVLDYTPEGGYPTSVSSNTVNVTIP